MEFLQSIYLECKRQLRFNWCRFSGTNNIMPIDFGLVNENIVIELDGVQHFSQVSNWTSPEKVMDKDIEKINKCIENGYSIIHIYQPDVWYDKYDWKIMLINVINELKEGKPMAVFISSNDSYDSHIEKIQTNINKKYIKYKI